MDSILGSIFLRIRERLLETVPELKSVDQDFSQLDNGSFPSNAFPFALLDLNEISYATGGQNSQTADRAVLLVKLVLLERVNLDGILAPPSDDDILTYYGIEQLVNRFLHGWCDPELFTPLMRVKAFREKQDTSSQVRVLQYEFSFWDRTAIEPGLFIDRPGLEFT